MDAVLMIRLLLRLLGLAVPQVPCWCGSMHKLGYWHDPTHGRIDRDIQEHARDLCDFPPYATRVSMGDKAAAKVHAIEETMQRQRAHGKVFYWEKATQS